MANFKLIGKKEGVPEGKMKAFSVEGKMITVANVEGKYLAFDDTCTHEHCSLSGGYLDGYTLTCYCHGGQFDISSGKVLAPPPPTPIRIYNVKIENENILVEV